MIATKRRTGDLELDDDGDGIPNFYDACNDTPEGVGVGPDGCAVSCFVDSDGDGYSSSVDCDDTNSLIHPGAAEICNGTDDDCDGQIDELENSGENEDSVCEDNNDGEEDDEDGNAARPYRRELRLIDEPPRDL